MRNLGTVTVTEPTRLSHVSRPASRQVNDPVILPLVVFPTLTLQDATSELWSLSLITLITSYRILAMLQSEVCRGRTTLILCIGLQSRLIMSALGA